MSALNGSSLVPAMKACVFDRTQPPHAEQSRVWKAIGLALASGLVCWTTVRAQPQSSFEVVVNASNPVTTLSKDQVSSMFLKRTTKWENGGWEDGGRVALVDQIRESPAREAFSLVVLGRNVDAVSAYWRRMIFTGRSVPPQEMASDREVLEFVRSNPHAIGYVSGGSVGDGVKVVSISDR